MKLLNKVIKASKRGLTFSFDRTLTESFDVGKHYQYTLNKENKTLTITPMETGLTVSRKKTTHDIKSLIDLRAKDVVSCFSSAKEVTITIFENYILVKAESNTYRISKAIMPRVAETPLEQVLDVVSVCSGAGLLDKAFMDEGFKINFAIDNDEGSIETYEHNIGHHIVCADMTNYPLENVPNAKIIIGGIPCKPFSKERCDYYSAKGAIEDHQDSKLILSYIEWIKSEYANYDMFVLENVPNLISASNGAYLRLLCEELSDFHISCGLFNDVDMGGYQSRKRAIIIGSKLGVVLLPEATTLPEEYKTVGMALEKVDDTWFNQQDYTKPREDTVEKMSYVPQGGNWKNIPEHLRSKGKHSNTYRRLHWDQPACTLVNFRKPNITHPLLDRTLTVSEASALSGLDKAFRFFGTLASKQQQIGNGVPLALGTAVAKAVKQHIMSNELVYGIAN